MIANIVAPYSHVARHNIPQIYTKIEVTFQAPTVRLLILDACQIDSSTISSYYLDPPDMSSNALLGSFLQLR